MSDLTRALFNSLQNDEPLEELRLLLEAGADPNASDEDGKPALFESGGGARLRLMIEYGGDVNATWNMGPIGHGRIARWANKLVPKDMRPDLDEPVVLTLADIALEPESIRFLVARGFDPFLFDRYGETNEIAIALGSDLIPEAQITPEEFNRHGTARAGTSNPEAYLPDFWREQIRTMRTGYAAEVDILGRRDYNLPSVPVWSFDRFGQSATWLPDGRLVLVAGEHEDHYDPDFCIYADVTVLDGKGGVAHFIYPAEIFPPTDFHSATLLGEHILLIGSLGYPDKRTEGITQVLRLNLDNFGIEQVETTGDNPGWIHRHKAELDDGRITITGGKIEPGYRDNSETYDLELATMHWSRR